MGEEVRRIVHYPLNSGFLILPSLYMLPHIIDPLITLIISYHLISFYSDLRTLLFH